MFEECRIKGYFVLSSGRKSSVFYDFDLLSPIKTMEYVEQLIKKVPDEVFNQINFIAAPALGGIIPGFLVALSKNLPLVVVDKHGLPRGQDFATGKYLIVDDVITSFKAANFVRSAFPELEAVGVCAYIFRGTDSDIESQNYPVFYLARKEQEK